MLKVQMNIYFDADDLDAANTYIVAIMDECPSAAGITITIDRDVEDEE